MEVTIDIDVNDIYDEVTQALNEVLMKKSQVGRVVILSAVYYMSKKELYKIYHDVINNKK